MGVGWRRQVGPVALRARVPALLFGVLRVRRFLYVHHHSRVRVPCFCFPSDVCCRPYRMPRSRRKVSSDEESSATTSSSDSGDASFESDQDGRNKRRRRRKTPRKTGHRHKKRIKKESAGKFRRRSKQQSPPASSPSPEERGKKTLHLVGACPFPCWVARKRAMEQKKVQWNKKKFRCGWQGGNITFRYQPRRSKQGGVDLDSPRFKAASPTGAVLEGANPSQIVQQYYEDCRRAHEYTRLTCMTGMCETVNEVFRLPANSKKAIHQATVRCGCPRTHTTTHECKDSTGGVLISYWAREAVGVEYPPK